MTLNEKVPSIKMLIRVNGGVWNYEVLQGIPCILSKIVRKQGNARETELRGATFFTHFL